MSPTVVHICNQARRATCLTLHFRLWPATSSATSNHIWSIWDQTHANLLANLDDQTLISLFCTLLDHCTISYVWESECETGHWVQWVTLTRSQSHWHCLSIRLNWHGWISETDSESEWMLSRWSAIEWKNAIKTFNPGAAGSTPVSSIAIVTFFPSYSGYLVKNCREPVSFLGKSPWIGKSVFTEVAILSVVMSRDDCWQEWVR